LTSFPVYIPDIDLTGAFMYGIESYLLSIRAETWVKVTAGVNIPVIFGNIERSQRHYSLILQTDKYPRTIEILVPVSVCTDKLAVR
jgi:hypothetical protein